ncbi:uncharacterized protein B0H18DRAFT_1132103 [Fomitopsis serialis]|uniref:uncharacterized protein n=1 Tax=Fomitopsis serialis TaxID=139415 RepID=UPI002008E2FA|nr:uncharacterized protein B0H18DRAFT_1132103 [Neoantrodia serialis]KAH9905538.1 hypothetical protein B0H18DRAFT_1132103 [Neoantrodia serialis]
MRGWVFLGAVGLFYQDWRRVPLGTLAGLWARGGHSQSGVVEALFFVKDLNDPISIWCEIDEKSKEMLIAPPTEQPLMLLTFPGLSPWRTLPRMGLSDTGFDIYDVERQTFFPASMLEDETPVLHLPLRQIPTFKLGHMMMLNRTLMKSPCTAKLRVWRARTALWLLHALMLPADKVDTSADLELACSEAGKPGVQSDSHSDSELDTAQLVNESKEAKRARLIDAVLTALNASGLKPNGKPVMSICSAAKVYGLVPSTLKDHYIRKKTHTEVHIPHNTS